MKPRYSFSSRRTGQARDPKNYLKQKKKFPEVAKQVLFESDIILQVLDARFINETRNSELENLSKKNKKKLIQVLNKSDLTDKSKIKIQYKNSIIVSGKNRTGIKKLRDKIKELAKDIKKEKITVGVLGYPNLGKSTIINLLVGKKVAAVGAIAGHTKGLQKLKLTSNIQIFDSPGVIPKDEYSTHKKEKIAKYVKVGSRAYSQIKDPEQVVTELFKEFPDTFQKHFKIKTKNPEVLIETLGKKLNFLKKGGVVDFDKTARHILKQWQKGNIKT